MPSTRKEAVSKSVGGIFGCHNDWGSPLAFCEWGHMKIWWDIWVDEKLVLIACASNLTVSYISTTVVFVFV